MNDKMLYLSNSIGDKESDVIGFDTYVNKLDDAIETGAQMIAVTSPFGSGKTSVIELLKKKREKRKREKFLNIQMWSQLNDYSSDSIKDQELHRNFLYQIGSAINPRKGTYINRRLSNNYGLLKLHVNKVSYWFYLIISIICTFVGLFCRNYSDIVIDIFPKIEGALKYIPFLMFFISVLFFVIVVTRAEIIFSSKKSENERIIEADEIIDLYRNEIINKRNKLISFLCNCLKRIPLIKKLPCLKGKKYIIVIEDLDRTDDNKAVIHFLKELRKYYVLTDDEEYKNSVVFIVTIKPEKSVVQKVIKRTITNELGTKEEIVDEVIEKNHSLYAKIFDYVINIQTINVLDYNTILCALLQEKKTKLDEYNLKSSTGVLSDIPGMQWMIRGQHLDIREIKKRLNTSIVIFETLRERYPDNKTDIKFEKCAVASYITTAFEADFINTPDKAFGNIVELFLQKKLTKEEVKKELSTQNDNYVNVVEELISSHHIGEDYRLYFYNYPKNSVVYTNEEIIVQNAILYGDKYESIETIAERVVAKGSNVLGISFKKLRQLKLPLTSQVIKTECLFLAAVQLEYDLVLEMFANMTVNEASLDKNISSVVAILNYDSDRKIYNKKILGDFCKAWESVFDEKSLVSLRETLCSQFSTEIIAYKQLFYADHNIISQKEMEKLSLEDSLTLLNVDSNNFSISHVKYIVDKFIKTSNTTDSTFMQICDILESACDKFGDIKVAEHLLDYMLKTSKIIPEFEVKVYQILTFDKDKLDEEDLDLEWQNKLFTKYKKLINSVQTKNLSVDVLSHVNTLYMFEDSYSYTLDVANSLYDNGYYLFSTLVKFRMNAEVNFEDGNIISGFKENLEWLENHEKEFLLARRQILIKSKNICEYMFLFSSKFVLLSKEDFDLLINNKNVSIINVLDFFPKEKMNTDAVEYVSKYFNKKHRNNNDAYGVLKSLVKYNDDIVTAFWEKINFSKSFLYYNFSADKKQYLKKIFIDLLELDTYDGMLRFMEMTRFLDETMEKALYNQMDSDMEKRYINIIRKKLGPSEVSQVTIQNLTSFSSYYPFNNSLGINKRLLEQKELLYYVISTTLYDKKFIMVQEDSIAELWPTYMELYNNPNNYSQTFAYMKENKDFLKRIISKEAYLEFSDASLETLVNVEQDEKIISYVFSKEKDFVVKYFSLLKAGFENYDSAKKFVEMISLSENINIAKNNNVRDNIYDRLVDPALKSKYTRIRKSYGIEY